LPLAGRGDADRDKTYQRTQRFGTPRSEGGLEAAIDSFIRNQRDVDERLNDYGAARLTSITGFPLPPFGLDPPRMVGILSLILLAIARSGYTSSTSPAPGAWIFIITATAALWLDAFVGVI
jgi:hypothetical protein